MEQDKIISGSCGIFFRDLGRSMHYFKGAREHRPPEGLIGELIVHVYQRFCHPSVNIFKHWASSTQFSHGDSFG